MFSGEKYSGLKTKLKEEEEDNLKHEEEEEN